MDKFGKILWRFFSAFLMMFWNAGDKTLASSNSEYSNTTYGSRTQICPRNQYVYSCNGVRVGYNWLSSKKLTYDYLTGSNLYEKINQMRKFFSAKAMDANTTENNSTPTKIQPSTTVSKDRDTILAYLCDPMTDTIVCASCPENATVASSYVKHDTYTDNTTGTPKLISGSWSFHTIADCYMTQFEDSTGSFQFIPPGTEASAQCYYTNTSSESEYAGDYAN